MALKSVTLKIYIYTGTAGSYTANDLKYTIQKERLSNQTNIVLEIGELVRDYIDVTFNNDYNSTAIWVTTAETLIEEETGVEYETGSPRVTNFLAFDGYGHFEDDINPQLSTHALYTSNNYYIPENTAGKFPIFAEGVGKVTIDTTDTQITDSGNSNQKIQYVTIPADSSTIKVYGTDDTTLLKTVTVNNICEPKYTSHKVTFVNKYGAYQDLYFFKKTVETFNVTDEMYKVNIVDSDNADYNTYDGQRQRYNTNAQTTLTMNTGFVKEDFTSAIEELFLSENVWIRWDGQTLPIVPKTKSFTQKTSLNDKLINYTVDFDFAFNKINNVR